MTHHAILVVDDNPDHRELTVLALGDCCSADQIATAPDGVEALDYLFGRGAHAQRGPVSSSLRLVLLDLKLTRMGGLEALRAIRAHPRTRTMPVVMLSSSDVKSDIAACYASGANSYVRKSSDFDDLARKLHQIYAFWLTVNEGFRHSMA